MRSTLTTLRNATNAIVGAIPTAMLIVMATCVITMLVFTIAIAIEVFATTGGAIMDNEMRFTIKELEDHSFNVYETTNNDTVKLGYDNLQELTEQWLIPYLEDKGIMSAEEQPEQEEVTEEESSEEPEPEPEEPEPEPEIPIIEEPIDSDTSQ